MCTLEEVETTAITINVALAFDQNFLVPSYALLASLFSNNRDVNFCFHAIATGITTIEKQDVEQYVKRNNSTIYFYTITSESLQGLVIPKNRHYTIATYYRLFFPQLVPASVERILYLDSDLIVNGDIQELYTLDMGTYPAAAVRELSSTIRPELGIHQNGACLNAGVLLMNLPEWKKRKVTERSVDFIQNFPYPEKIRFADQDALNVILKDNYLPIDRKYNVCFYDVPQNETAKQYRDFVSDKIIIHYTLTHKPWNPLGKNRLRFLYFHYLMLSPKADTKKFEKLDFTIKNILKFVKLRFQEAICNHLPFLAKRLSKTIFWRWG